MLSTHHSTTWAPEFVWSYVGDVLEFERALLLLSSRAEVDERFAAIAAWVYAEGRFAPEV